MRGGGGAVKWWATAAVWAAIFLSSPALPALRPLCPCSALPNAGLWEEFNSLVTDGLLFVLSGFRRSARGGGGRGFAMMGKGAGAAGLNSAEPTPLFAGSSSGSSDGAKGAVAFGEL